VEYGTSGLLKWTRKRFLIMRPTLKKCRLPPIQYIMSLTGAMPLSQVADRAANELGWKSV